MSAICQTFQKLKKQGNAALIGYLTGGDPGPRYSPLIAEALIKGGADILELGIPFSDPIADGPTIQAATVRALKAGTTPKIVLSIASVIREKHGIPVVILTYYNPIFRMGLEKFFRLAKSCQIDGLIVPDLPVEEAGDYRKAAKDYGVDTIFLAAPSTSADRLRKIVDCTSGFLYLVSHFGVTGEKSAIDSSTVKLVKKVLPYVTGRVPLAVGFGISKPEHARCLFENGADAVIVGSTFVNIVQRNLGNIDKTLSDIEKTARSLKNATLS